MKNKSVAPKSCDPQLFPQTPKDTWDVEALAKYARKQEQAIVKGEQSLTIHYWLMGQVLDLARPKHSRALWGPFLESLGIEKTRASKARAIYRAFAKESDVQNLSVQQAYEKRKCPPKKTQKPAKKMATGHQTASEPMNLVEFLVDVCRRAELCASQVATVSADEVATILSAFEEAMQELTELRSVLSHRLAKTDR